MFNQAKKVLGAIILTAVVVVPLQMAQALTVTSNDNGGYDPPNGNPNNTSSKVPMDDSYKGSPGTSSGGSSGSGNTSDKVPTGGSDTSGGNTSSKVPIDCNYKGAPGTTSKPCTSDDNGNTSDKVPLDPNYKGPPGGPSSDDKTVSECDGRPYPKDIDGHWAEIYIRRLYDLCIIEGYKDGLFHPEQSITRAELTKMSLYSRGIDPNTGCYDNDCGSPFMDLDAWQGKWIRPAWDRHIVQGYTTTSFRPNQSITRAEASKVILATFGYGPLNVTDSFFDDVSGWSVGWIEQAHQIGLVQGVGNGNFDPNRPITRAEAAKIIAKMIDYWDTKL